MDNVAQDPLARIDEIYTSFDAAVVFGVLPETVVMWIRLGKLKARKMGGRWLIPVEEIDRLEREKAYR